jgi:hypothetical protein
MLLGQVAPEMSGWTASDCPARVQLPAAEPQALVFPTRLPDWPQSLEPKQLMISRAPKVTGWTASSHPTVNFPIVRLALEQPQTLVFPTSLPEWRGALESKQLESKQLGVGAGPTSRVPEVATWTEATPLAAAEAQTLACPTSLPDWRGTHQPKQLESKRLVTSQAPEVAGWTASSHPTGSFPIVRLAIEQPQTLVFPTRLPDWRGAIESKQLESKQMQVGAGPTSRAPEMATWTGARQFVGTEARTLTFPTRLPEWRWSLESKQLVTGRAPEVAGWTASSFPTVSFPKVRLAAAEAQTLIFPTSLPDWRGSRASKLLGTASGQAPLWVALSSEPASTWVGGTRLDLREKGGIASEAASTNLLYPTLMGLRPWPKPAVPPSIPVRLDLAVQFDRRRHHRPPKLLADSTGFQRVRAAAHIRIREPELHASCPSDLPAASARMSWRGLRIGPESIPPAGAPVPLRPVVLTPAWAE